MNVLITDGDGRTPEQAIHNLLQKTLGKLRTESGKVMQLAVSQTVKRHFQTKYPGSTHYSPSKVQDGRASGNKAEVIIDVPGVTRAYHDVVIVPKISKKLAIPIHRDAYGTSPRDTPGLFYAKNAKGTEMLAKIEGGALVAMYILKDRVHQRQDRSLMPSDQTIVDNVGARLAAWLRPASI